MVTMSQWATIPQEHRYLDSVAPKNLFYGTAWKGEDTAHLVYTAIKAGFRSFATAAQPKHYREDLVGEGVRRAIQENIVTRKDLYVSRPLAKKLGVLVRRRSVLTFAIRSKPLSLPFTVRIQTTVPTTRNLALPSKSMPQFNSPGGTLPNR